MPLITPSTRSPSAPPINTTLVGNHILFNQDLERQNYQTSLSKSTTKRAEQTTEKMAPKQTRAMKSKVKELEYVVSPLVKWLRNIKNAKVQEVSWARHWNKIKTWAYRGKSRMTEEAKKVNHSTIMNFMNAPIMEIFGGTKETIIKS